MKQKERFALIIANHNYLPLNIKCSINARTSKSFYVNSRRVIIRLLAFSFFWESNSFLLSKPCRQRMCESDERIFLFQIAFQDITDAAMRDVCHKASGTRR